MPEETPNPEHSGDALAHRMNALEDAAGILSGLDGNGARLYYDCHKVRIGGVDLRIRPAMSVLGNDGSILATVEPEWNQHLDFIEADHDFWPISVWFKQSGNDDRSIIIHKVGDTRPAARFATWEHSHNLQTQINDCHPTPIHEHRPLLAQEDRDAQTTPDAGDR